MVAKLIGSEFGISESLLPSQATRKPVNCNGDLSLWCKGSVIQYKKYFIYAAEEMCFHSLFPGPLGSWICKMTTF